jgi:hypothetical protein
LPDRTRLFFRPFEAEGRHLLLILWLGFPRKDVDRNDCYAAFTRQVQCGELRENWETLQRERGVDGAIVQALKKRAGAHGRSQEAGVQAFWRCAAAWS